MIGKFFEALFCRNPLHIEETSCISYWTITLRFWPDDPYLTGSHPPLFKIYKQETVFVCPLLSSLPSEQSLGLLVHALWYLRLFLDVIPSLA